MSRFVITNDRMREILNGLAKEKRVVAPVQLDKNIEFMEISKADDILFNGELPYKSPKEYLFPQFEKIITFENDEVKAANESKETIIFGVKPCDLDALKVMITVFTTGAFKDPFFVEHLEKTVIIGVECLSEKSGCFCKEREIDMSMSENCDIFLGVTDGGYTVEHLTDKGKDLLNKFEPQAVSDCSCKKPVKPEANVIKLNEEIEELKYFNDVNWEDKTEICQACGMCTFICPTCHCFEFKDVKKDGVTNRYRCWDSCMYPKFTLHASGHNPRNAIKDRYRQRVMHKYVYVKKNFGYTACTGCGRCIRSCPAGMNIKKVVTEIMEELS